jgi:preprotein translocase subunit YajC
MNSRQADWRAYWVVLVRFVALVIIALAQGSAAMFITPAFAQAAPAASPFGGMEGIIPLLIMLPIFYFLLIRPQQQKQKQHREMIMQVKRNDTVILSNGMIGTVTKVKEGDAEVEVEIAPNTKVRVVKSMLADVRGKNEPVKAND